MVGPGDALGASGKAFKAYQFLAKGRATKSYRRFLTMEALAGGLRVMVAPGKENTDCHMEADKLQPILERTPLDRERPRRGLPRMSASPSEKLHGRFPSIDPALVPFDDRLREWLLRALTKPPGSDQLTAYANFVVPTTEGLEAVWLGAKKAFYEALQGRYERDKNKAVVQTELMTALDVTRVSSTLRTTAPEPRKAVTREVLPAAASGGVVFVGAESLLQVAPALSAGLGGVAFLSVLFGARVLNRHAPPSDRQVAFRYAVLLWVGGVMAIEFRRPPSDESAQEVLSVIDQSIGRHEMLSGREMPDTTRELPPRHSGHSGQQEVMEVPALHERLQELVQFAKQEKEDSLVAHLMLLETYMWSKTPKDQWLDRLKRLVLALAD